jgi:hypothetical protein
MYATAVADPGGLLAAAGVVEGLRHDVVEYVALDAATLLLAEFLVVLHEGHPARAAADYAELQRLVREWFPVRALAMDAVLRAPAETADVDTWAALALAEMLGIPLVTKHAEIRSRKIPVLHS